MGNGYVILYNSTSNYANTSTILTVYEALAIDLAESGAVSHKCMVPYTFVIPNLDILQMHDGVSIKKTITPHTVPFFLCRTFHPRTAENGENKDELLCYST